MRVYGRVVAGLGLLLAALCGCASPARVESMIPEARAEQAANPNSPLYRNIVLTDVGGGEETNPILHSEISSPAFRETLLRALDRQGYLSTEKTAPFELTAFIVEVKHPVAGFTLVVDTFVRYTLARAGARDVVFDDVLQGTFAATVGDEFYGVERLRLAEEGSMRANISALFDRLRATAIVGPR